MPCARPTRTCCGSRYPACCLFLELDPATVDVNVSGQDRSRFRDSRASALQFVYHAVQQGPGSHLVAPPRPQRNINRQSPGTPTTTPPRIHAATSGIAARQRTRHRGLHRLRGRPAANGDTSPASYDLAPAAPTPARDGEGTAARLCGGPVARRLSLAQNAAGMVVVDMHAAANASLCEAEDGDGQPAHCHAGAAHPRPSSTRPPSTSLPPEEHRDALADLGFDISTARTDATRGARRTGPAAVRVIRPPWRSHSSPNCASTA